MSVVLEGQRLGDLIRRMKPYRKVRPILAIQIQEDVVLGPGLEGSIRGLLDVQAGSWIAHDPVTGKTWPIGEEDFPQVYEEDVL